MLCSHVERGWLRFVKGFGSRVNWHNACDEESACTGLIQTGGRNILRIKFIAGFCILALSALAAGCADNSNTANSNTTTTNTVATTTTTTEANMNAVEPSKVSDAADSEISETTDTSGAKVQTRTFRNDTRVSKVVVTTTKAGKRTAKVYPRDGGAPRDLPENKVESALQATGNTLADAAGFVVDKTKDAASATKEGAQKVGEKTVEGAKTVGEKTAEGAKTVGSKTAEGAKTVGEKTVEGAKKAGEGAKKVGGKIKDAVTP
jgi:hypothetical protein